MEQKMKSKIFFISLFIGLMLSSVASAELNWSSVQTLSQVNGNITIPSNNSYVGAIKIYDIDVSNIQAINITSTTYSMNITFIKDSYIFGLITPVTITTSFHDKLLNTSQTRTIKTWKPKPDSFIFLPYFIAGYVFKNKSSVTNIAIYNDIAYFGYDLNTAFMQPLINTPYNSSYLMYAKSSKVVKISITGQDKVDIDYVAGSSSEVSAITSNFAEDTSTSLGDFLLWVLSKIPWIGEYIKLAVEKLTILFTIVFQLIGFLYTDLDIIFLMVLSFAELHGIIIMAAGGTPFDGVNHPVRDILFVFKQTYMVLVMFFTLIWKIIQSIATAIP